MRINLYPKFIILSFIISIVCIPAAYSAGNVVAKVAGQPLTKADLDYEMSLQISADDTIGLDINSAKKKVLDNLINKRILILEAVAQKIEPAPEAIESQIQNRKEILGGGDPEKFKQALKKQGLNEKQLRQQLIDEYRITGLLKRSVYSFLTPISLQDAQSYYKEHQSEYTTPDSVRIRHIFITLNQNTTTDVKLKQLKKAEEALDKINKGEDFAQVAHDYSESPTAAVGGDLGRPIRRGELTSFPEVEKEAFSLDSGKTSDIIKTAYGFHIIKVEEKESGHVKPFDLVKVEILDKMTKIRAEDRYNQWFQSVKSKYAIEIFPENM